MNKRIAKSQERRVEKIERAAWFARLALGTFSDDQVPVPAERRGVSEFRVMP